MKRLLMIFLLIHIIGCKTNNDCSYQKPIDLNDGLLVSTLEKHNLDKSVFDKINQDIYDGKYGNIHSLLVIENNDLVIEQSLSPDDPNNMGNKVEQTDDWLKSSLLLPMDAVPGTKYVYCGPNDIILSEIIKKSTGQTIAGYAEKNLFKPLKIKEYEWFSKNGIFDSGGGLKLKSRDIAKYGLLHLNKGKWGNNEIVPESWIAEIFSPYIEIKPSLYSCYQWQMVKTNLGFNVWFIPGNGGQIINIIPALNMVVVINSDNREIPKEKRIPLEHLLQNIIKIKRL
ncbi:MAG: serine hydrolase [Bacteroidales bacterium]|nr:serine hydrolase [Bacteroidales bacterium]